MCFQGRPACDPPKRGKGGGGSHASAYGVGRGGLRKRRPFPFSGAGILRGDYSLTPNHRRIWFTDRKRSQSTASEAMTLTMPLFFFVPTTFG